jgi:hypothetical protein
VKKLLLIIVLLYLPVAGVLADDALYSGEVAIPSQSDADRLEAIPEALIQVLQKISGQRELPLSETLDNAIANAQDLVLSFRYRNAERLSPEGDVIRELRLIVQFMRADIDNIVQQAGLPRWRQERPPVQLWVVVDDGIRRELKPLEYDYAWQSMEEVAVMRGLPVSWPELDEEEVQLIDMSLVWGGFTDYLVERGAPADGVAIVAVRRDGPSWDLRWNLTSNGQHWSWRNSDQELMFALAQGVHLMADETAAANAIAASEQDSWTTELTVGGLRNADDYAACLGYLQGLSLVTSVDVLGVEPGQVQFRLQLNAPTEYLADAFNRGTVLLPTDAQVEYDYEFLHYGHD